MPLLDRARREWPPFSAALVQKLQKRLLADAVEPRERKLLQSWFRALVEDESWLAGAGTGTRVRGGLWDAMFDAATTSPSAAARAAAAAAVERRAVEPEAVAEPKVRRQQQHRRRGGRAGGRAPRRHCCAVAGQRRSVAGQRQLRRLQNRPRVVVRAAGSCRRGRRRGSRPARRRLARARRALGGLEVDVPVADARLRVNVRAARLGDVPR
mmetsp:Transcript_32322/g.113740  ORF Transcript_32322/g.113740 Transcript_32322/m.113740 type:complete len:211 (+) Transcript_32322:941-1573(+)